MGIIHWVRWLLNAKQSEDNLVSTSKLLIAILLTAFAFGATTVSASARVKGSGQQSAATAQGGGSGGVPACGNGMVARYHTVSGVKHWHCVKA
jgi:hypothetical protein